MMIELDNIIYRNISNRISIMIIYQCIIKYYINYIHYDIGR